MVGIINPDEKVLKGWAEEMGMENKNLEELCANEEIRKKVHADIGNQQRAAKFKGFERVVHIYLDSKSFESLGLLTTTFKIKRNDAKEHYQREIEEMYEIQRKIDEEKAKKE